MSTLAGRAFFVGDLFPGENLHLHSKVRGKKLQAAGIIVFWLVMAVRTGNIIRYLAFDH